MTARVWLLGCLPLTAVVACLAPPKPAPAVPPPSAAQVANPTAAPETAKAATADAELDPKVVAVYVRAHLSKVRDCWVRSLQTDPTLAGRIAIHWTIDADGAARNVRVESNSMQASSVADCVRALIAEWRFPNPTRASVEVSFPFTFLPNDGSAAPRPGSEKTPL